LSDKWLTLQIVQSPFDTNFLKIRNIFCICLSLILTLLESRLNDLQPVVDEFVVVLMEGAFAEFVACFDSSAARVAHHDDVRNVQPFDCLLDG